MDVHLNSYNGNAILLSLRENYTINYSLKKTRASEPLGESRAVVHRKNIKFFRLRCIPVKLSLCTYT